MPVPLLFCNIYTHTHTHKYSAVWPFCTLLGLFTFNTFLSLRITLCTLPTSLNTWPLTCSARQHHSPSPAQLLMMMDRKRQIFHEHLTFTDTSERGKDGSTQWFGCLMFLLCGCDEPVREILYKYFYSSMSVYLTEITDYRRAIAVTDKLCLSLHGRPVLWDTWFQWPPFGTTSTGL